MSTLKFEVGKKYRARDGRVLIITHIDFPGKYPVIGVNADCAHGSLSFTRVGTYWYNFESRYDLVEEVKEEKEETVDELDKLIDIANKGHEAEKVMRDTHFNEVEYQHIAGWSPLAQKKPASRRFRRRPKPTFETFKLKEGWEVKDLGDEISIGCQTFNKSEVISALDRLINYSSCSEVVLSGLTLATTRHYVRYSGNLISWESVDLIFERVKKYDEKS